MRGIVPELVRRIAGHKFFREFVSFKTGRGEDQQVATKLLLVEFRGDLVDTKKAQLDRLVDEGAKAEASGGEFERAAARVLKVLDSMTDVFIPADPLLSSQGPLVVYYWMIRQLGPRPDIREFLLSFERERQANRNRAKDPAGGGPIDSDYFRYDALNRSINDVGSLQCRARILLSRYRPKSPPPSNLSVSGARPDRNASS